MRRCSLESNELRPSSPHTNEVTSRGADHPKFQHHFIPQLFTTFDSTQFVSFHFISSLQMLSSRFIGQLASAARANMATSVRPPVASRAFHLSAARRIVHNVKTYCISAALTQTSELTIYRIALVPRNSRKPYLKTTESLLTASLRGAALARQLLPSLKSMPYLLLVT